MTITPDAVYELSDAARGMLEDAAISLAELYRLLREPQQSFPTTDGKTRVNGYGLTAVVDGRQVFAVGIDGATIENRGEWARERAIFGDADTATADAIVARDLEPRVVDDEAKAAAKLRARQERELRALIARTVTPRHGRRLPGTLCRPAAVEGQHRVEGLVFTPADVPVEVPADVPAVSVPVQRPEPLTPAAGLLVEEIEDELARAADEAEIALARVHPALHREITRQVAGDWSRLEVHSATKVTIHEPAEEFDEAQ